MHFTRSGSVVLTKAEVRALLVFTPKTSEHPGSVLSNVCVDRCYTHGDPDVRRGRVVATDGHSLLMLESPGEKGSSRILSDAHPRRFTVPAEKLAEWAKLLRVKTHALLLNMLDGRVVPVLVDTPVLGDLPFEVARPSECPVGPEFVGYERELGKVAWRPLGKPLRAVHPTWFDAELLSRLLLVQKATGLKRPGYAAKRAEAAGVRLQLGKSKPSEHNNEEQPKAYFPDPMRFDTPRIPEADCWASGVICGMFSDEDRCRYG